MRIVYTRTTVFDIRISSKYPLVSVSLIPVRTSEIQTGRDKLNPVIIFEISIICSRNVVVVNAVIIETLRLSFCISTHRECKRPYLLGGKENIEHACMRVKIFNLVGHVGHSAFSTRLLFIAVERLHKNLIDRFGSYIISVFRIAIAVEIRRVISDITKMNDIGDFGRTRCSRIRKLTCIIAGLYVVRINHRTGIPVCYRGVDFHISRIIVGITFLIGTQARKYACIFAIILKFGLTLLIGSGSAGTLVFKLPELECIDTVADLNFRRRSETH